MLYAIHSSIHQSWAVSSAPRPDCTAQHSQNDTTPAPLSLSLSFSLFTAQSMLHPDMAAGVPLISDSRLPSSL